VFDAMRAAKSEILLETFIVFEDKVGAELQQILIDAARRGVRTTVSLDGFGCGELTTGYLAALSDAGVHLQMFDPAPKHLGFRTNWFRRLHRKIVVVDGLIAFIGGINFSGDHLADFGPEAKQDYAVQVQGRRSLTSITLPCCKAVARAAHASGGNVGASVGQTWLSAITTVRCAWCFVTTISTTPTSKTCTCTHCAGPNAGW
jgi:hypothetical protein